MKRTFIFILLLAIASTVGCTQVFDPIVGTWHYGKYMHMTFNPDGSVNATLSIFGIPSQFTGTWKNLGQNRYQVTYLDPEKNQMAVGYLMYDTTSESIYFENFPGARFIKG